MKKIKFKLSKTGWIILSAGVFIVILAGLGVTYSAQLKENSELQDKLAISELRLDKFNIADLEEQEAALLAQLETSLVEFDNNKTIMQNPVQSIDVTEKCYYIAYESSVVITDIGTTDVQEEEFCGLPCYRIAINVQVEGTVSQIVNFIENINEGFTTGYIETIRMYGERDEEPPYASIQMVVYSYKED